MHIICMTPIADGVYNDHRADHITTVPDGWAMIPEDFPLPSTFTRLGSIEAEELTYTREVEKTREVTKSREVEVPGPDGQPITIIEEYKETETYTEEVPYTMMTVTAMTPGVVPEPEPEPEAAPTQLDRVEAQVTYTAMMTDTLLEV